MSNVPRSECDPDTDVTRSFCVIRYEEDGNKLVAVCEDGDGNRFYQTIMIGGEVVF